MNAGLNDTFQFLTKTDNEAAVDVLAAGVDCPHKAIRDRALRSLLTRSSPKGHQEVFRRLPKLDKRCRSIISARPERLLRAATAALEMADKATCVAALEGILSFRLYDTIPALLAIARERDNPNFDLAVRTVLRLTELFYQELSDSRKRSKRHDLDNVRRRVTLALEEAAARFNTHRRTEIIEAFLMVAKPQNVTLRRILRQPGERSQQAVTSVLSSSTRGGVIRVLLGFLEDPQMPNAVKDILARRKDVKFLKNLLQTTGARPSRSMTKTLARFSSFAWANPADGLLKELDGTAQYNAVQLLTASSMSREELFEIIEFLLLKGRVGGRRAAAQRLAEFEGPRAEELVVKALGDEDPVVRSHLIRQVRSRQIPGAMSLLIGMVGSPHDEVRQALREALPEFTLQHFLANFDKMADELLPTAAHLVRKIDADVRPRLTEEMKGRSPVRRRRAVLASAAMGLAREMEQLIIDRLSDDDHMVRIVAAKALAECDTMPTWEALRDALLDRSVMVQEAAEQSLTRICQYLAPKEDDEVGEEGQEETEEVFS